MKETTLRQTTGFILWTVSGLMSLSLYLGYAGVNWYSLAIAVALSIALEAGKILSFRRDGLRFKMLAVCISSMTLLSILGSTLMTIDARTSLSLQNRTTAIESSREYQDILIRQRELSEQSAELQRRILVLPDDWVSMTIKLTSELNSINNQRALMADKLAEMERTASVGSLADRPSIFKVLGTVIGEEESTVEVVVLLILAILVEVTAFSLAGHAGERLGSGLGKAQGIGRTERATETREPNPPEMAPNNQVASEMETRSHQVTPDAYLVEALNHPNAPYLLGRAKVVEKLGITQSEARDILERLVADGKVRRDSKFFVAL